MIPTTNKIYFLEYFAHGSDSAELSYMGPGKFTGKVTENENSPDQTLYWFDGLKLENGFTDGGWFAEEDIKAEMNYGQERQTA